MRPEKVFGISLLGARKPFVQLINGFDPEDRIPLKVERCIVTDEWNFECSILEDAGENHFCSKLLMFLDHPEMVNSCH